MTSSAHRVPAKPGVLERFGLRTRRRPPAAVEPFEPRSADDLAFDGAEVKQLWWFFDGSLTSPGTGQHLRRSWGFCPRHAWAFTVAAAELRKAVFQPCVLYADLTERAAVAVRRTGRRQRSAARSLTPRDSCLTCDYCDAAGTDPSSEGRAQLVNERQHIAEFLSGCQDQWRSRACPECLGGDGVPCRGHLLAGRAAVPAGVAARLDDVHRRLEALKKSFGPDRPAATADQQSALVEAVSFFAGWRPADLIVATTSPKPHPRATRDHGGDGDLRHFVEHAAQPYLAAEALRTLVAQADLEELRPWLEHLAGEAPPAVRTEARHALDRLAHGTGS